jgi:hypothetical protein
LVFNGLGDVMKKFISTLVVLLSMVFFAGTAISGSADLEKDLDGSFRRSLKVIEQARNKLSKGLPIKSETTQLQLEAEGIRASNFLLDGLFKSRGRKARELGGKARQRQEEMEARYREVFRERLQPLLDELAEGGSVSSSTLESLQELLEQLVPAKKYPILGSLPYSHLNYPAREPVAEPLIVPAYRGGNRNATAADTASTAAASITPEIAGLAESLDWNPVRIYEWVQKNIETEWYRGSMKGARETLRQKSGNDADQASLLIALLRSAGFPARYVRGVIEFFPGIEKVKSLTGLDDPLKISAFFRKAGIPCEPIIVGSTIVNFRLEHIWVETEVPYANYRGALLDNMGKTWIALDTHLKPAGYQWNTPEDFGADFDLPSLPKNYLSELRAETPLEYLRGAFEQYLEESFSAATYDDHLRTRTLDFVPQGILPASLQFQSTAVTGEYVELPVDLRHRANITASATDGNELFNIVFDVADLSNRIVSLSYEAETVEDQQIIDSYGGLDNTPSYLIRLRPVLKIDDERKIVGADGLPMGEEYLLTVGIVSPHGRQDVVSRHVVGNISSLGIVSQQVVGPEVIPAHEKNAERLLHESALSYIERWNSAEEELASFLKVTVARPLPTVVTVGGVIDVAYLFGVPQGFDWKGLFIDAGFRRIETIAASTRDERAREFIRLSALEGSILENRIFEDEYGVDSVSTAKLLASASQTISLDGTNADSLVPTLGLPEHVAADILNAIHQGFNVTLPTEAPGYKNWTGIAYIKENPATGEAGYMLSGMIAGGMTAEEWADQVLRERFENAYSEPPNQDPGAAARIIVIPVGDRQNSTVGQKVEEPLAVLVTDIKGRPVVGAEVTFTVLGGGAHFDGAGSVQTTTGGNGIAKVSPTLGTSTQDNPSYVRLEQGDTYLTQVGVNLFSAAVTGRYGTLPTPKPFEVYGRPDVPVSMLKVVGDGNASMANNSAGTIKVLAVDRYRNPVSNVPVTFRAESATSRSSVVALPPGYRSITFYDNNECTSEYPLYGECASSAVITRMTAHYGAGVNAILGNTVNTRYEVSAETPGVPGEIFTLYSGGYWTAGEYLPPQLFVRNLTRINDQGEEVNAAKAGEKLKAPLVATMIMMQGGYTMEGPTNCTKYNSKGESYQTDCWTVKGDGLITTERITDGSVDFTAVSGEGSAADTENLGDGSYQTAYTTGSTPSLNLIEAVGKANVSVPEVFGSYYGAAYEAGYTTGTLAMRTVELRSGQKGLFSRSTNELISQTPQTTDYDVYGVDVKTEIAPKVLFLGEENLSRSDLTVTYKVLPEGAAPGGYGAVSAQVDLSSSGLSGETTWEDYLVGSSVRGTGTAVFNYGREFDPEKDYSVQPVLNRGGDIEIKGDEVDLTVVSVDLDIDSDNNAGFKTDGTHNDPQRGSVEDQVEELSGAPGKVIRLNLLDVDGDKVPGFADGINLYGNEGEGASAPFVPLLLEIDGNIDPDKARIRFVYSASDPAAVTKETDADGKEIYTPGEGHLRLWTRNGGQSRNTASLKGGGDFVGADELYSFADLGQKTADGFWRLWVEGVKDSLTAEEGQIRIEIDPDGSGQAYYVGDLVQTTVRSFALIPDYNHNRRIDEEDRQRALAGDTFYFWINDDDDEGETEGDDIPGDHRLLGELDNENKVVDGVRDLIDFFPVQLDLQGLLNIFSVDEYSYTIKAEGENLNVLFTSLDSQNVGNYLTDVNYARQIAESYIFGVDRAGIKLLPYDGGQLPFVCPSLMCNDGRVAFEGFVQNLKQGQSVILLEGSGAGQQPLVLEITDRAGNVAFQIELSLSLDGVEQMFRHLNLIPDIANKDGENDQPEQGSKERGEPDRFLEVSEQPSNYPDSECGDSYFVMLHGFKVNGQDARGWHTEMFKRLYWSGSRARFVGVSWYSFENIPDYHQNVVNAFSTASIIGPNLKPVVGDRPVFLMAHSLGNMVVSSYLEDHYGQSLLEQRPDIEKYFMFNAAVPLEAYLGDYQGYAEGNGTQIYSSDNPMVHPAWYGYKKRLGSSEWHQLFNTTDDPRLSLTWRDRFADISEKSVDVYSFYSRGEDVLGTHSGDPGFFEAVGNAVLNGGRYSWAFQEKWKGRAPYDGYGGTTLMGWAFNSDYYVLSDKTAANTIPGEQLKTIPFFRKPQAGMLGSELFEAKVSSEYVSMQRNELLAKALPALTLPTGGLEGRDMFDYVFIGENNVFDMDAQVGEWPRVNKEWRHSDIKKVAFPYVFSAFKIMVEKGLSQ